MVEGCRCLNWLQGLQHSEQSLGRTMMLGSKKKKSKLSIVLICNPGHVTM